MKIKTAILSGSFNPIHIGHTVIANYVVEYTNVNELWFVVSPHNPLKNPESILNEQHRLKMLEIAISHFILPFKICDVEMKMPKPSYTIDTLTVLSKNYPDREFVLVMGADSIAQIEQWKNYEEILNNYTIFVYPRVGYDTESLCHKYRVESIAAPLINISATFIRDALENNKNVESFLPYGVHQYIEQYKLYK